MIRPDRMTVETPEDALIITRRYAHGYTVQDLKIPAHSFDLDKKTADIIEDALEKQIQKPCERYTPDFLTGVETAQCPRCRQILMVRTFFKYCYYCGQAIDWSAFTQEETR